MSFSSNMNDPSTTDNKNIMMSKSNTFENYNFIDSASSPYKKVISPRANSGYPAKKNNFEFGIKPKM